MQGSSGLLQVVHSNGAPETSVHLIRRHANLPTLQAERVCGAKEGQVLFNSAHPMHGRSLIHAYWLHNRFTLNAGKTPFEACFDKWYRRKLCMFGERMTIFLNVFEDFTRGCASMGF